MVSKHTLNIPIVILAAGASERMGTAKQLLPWGNHTLLGHSMEMALKLEDNDVYVVLGANFPIIKKEASKFPVTIIENKAWELGLGTSIACAMNYLLGIDSKVDGVLICLADQPFISSNFLNTLLQNFTANKNEIIATSYKDGLHGVPVIFDKKYMKELSMLSSDKGAKIVLEKYNTLVKAIMPNFENIDIDNREEYEKWYRLNFKT